MAISLFLSLTQEAMKMWERLEATGESHNEDLTITLAFSLLVHFMMVNSLLRMRYELLYFFHFLALFLLLILVTCKKNVLPPKKVR